MTPGPVHLAELGSFDKALLHVTHRIAWPRPWLVVVVVGVAAACVTLCACAPPVDITAMDAEPGVVSIVYAPSVDRAPPPLHGRLLGAGWYPNVEVDADDRVHIAFVDADAGDVLYAESNAGPPTFA